MSIGSAVGVTLIALCTLWALRPLGGRLWFLGIAVNELPLLHLLVLVVPNAIAVAQGDVDSAAGWVVVGLVALAAAGLVVLIRRGLQARPTVERAIDALPDGQPVPQRTSVARSLLAPLPVRGRDVERTANISYGDAGRRNLLDVYRHRSHPTGAPTLVYFHGGRFTVGDKHREGRPLLHRLASQGWTCISANYRLGGPGAFPDHLVDAKKVLAWVREHGHEHGADPSTVIMAGSSAGAHMAATAALTPGDPRFQPGFETADTSISAAVCLYGYYGSLSAHPVPSSPLDHPADDAPPIFVAHGDLDSLTSVEGARALVAHLRAGSQRPVAYAELPGGHHSFDLFHSVRNEAVVDGIEAFTTWVRAHAGSLQR